MKIILINWLDSKGLVTHWEFKDDLKPQKPAYCVSVGFLLEETKEAITIVQSDSPDQILGRLTIPKCAITKRKILKV